MKRFTLTRIGAIAAIGGLTGLAAAISAQPASAAIRCEGNFQITQYGRIATPYCQDNYLAQVARQAGMNVSDRAVRYNPGVKRRACRLVGHDIRVKDTCAGYLPEDDGFDWR